ncbi:thiamine phosphate synthase [Robertmurraya korlensis]|uniref:thiamine phosphate synthase n=1 Tax=Robertmurraya korlensis TaxID=519977 RepID=UPI0020416A0E|nr:thiamine phosphate synthase [Robertmurraya korlensis]MCM3601361.1 thiamine phosphate synthase [Robertmurraya korlensis]
MKKELHVISTGQQEKAEMIKISRSIHSYVDYIHIRENHRSPEEILHLIQGMKEADIPLSKVILNGSSSVALAGGVSGVQLSHRGEDVLMVKKHYPMLRVGCSTHSLSEALEKEKRGADFLLFGHVFESNSKPGLRPRGLHALQEITAYVAIPVIAIGGIAPSNVKDVLTAGACGVAVLSGIFGADDPSRAALNYHKELEVIER